VPGDPEIVPVNFMATGQVPVYVGVVAVSEAVMAADAGARPMTKSAAKKIAAKQNALRFNKRLP
jgi:hypothetical protein